MTQRKQFLKTVISLSLEPQQNTGTDLDQPAFKVIADCSGCQNKCVMSFVFPVRLSFAFGDKLVGVFSSLCEKLEKEQAARNFVPPNGRSLLELSVDGGKYGTL